MTVLLPMATSLCLLLVLVLLLFTHSAMNNERRWLAIPAALADQAEADLSG